MFAGRRSGSRRAHVDRWWLDRALNQPSSPGAASPEPNNAGAPVPRLSTQINLLCQIAFGILAMAACLPSMPYWIEHFGESQQRVQLTLSAYLLAFAFTQLIYGPLSDNYGRRKILMLGLLVGLVGSVAAIAADSLNTLIAARVLQGAGTCAGMAVGRAMIQDSFVGPARTKMMAYMGMVMGLCPPAGTLLGGHLHVTFGWRASFVVIAVLAIALLIMAWIGLPGGKPPNHKRRTVTQMLLSYRQLITYPRYMSFCVIAACSSATFYVFLGGAPIVLDAYGVTPDNIGWYILFVPSSYILGSLATSRLVGRRSDLQLMWIGQILTALGVALVIALSLAGLHHPLALAVPLTLLGIGHGLLMPGTLAGAISAMPSLAGAAAAMAGMLQQLTGAAASALTGYVNLGTAAGMAGLMMSFTLLAIAAQLLLRNE